jgi:serine/threonine protein kinase
MELATGGSLTSVLNDPEIVSPFFFFFFFFCDTFQDIEWAVRWQWASEAAAAVAFLHSKGIIHRDIKSPNFLLVDGKLKITDFGLSTLSSMASIQTRTNNSNEVSVGTARWAAPESCARKPVVNEKSDVYALGIVLWEIAARAIPFFEVHDNAQVIALVRYENARPDIPPDCPESFSNIFTRCWEGGPQARPTAPEVHELLAKKFEEFKLHNYVESAGEVSEVAAEVSEVSAVGLSVSSTSNSMYFFSLSLPNLLSLQTPLPPLQPREKQQPLQPNMNLHHRLRTNCIFAYRNIWYLLFILTVSRDSELIFIVGGVGSGYKTQQSTIVFENGVWLTCLFLFFDMYYLGYWRALEPLSVSYRRERARGNARGGKVQKS